MKPGKRTLLAIAAFAVVALVAGSVLRGRSIGAVDAGRVTLGPLESTIREDGFTRVKEEYVVSAPVTGRLLRTSLDVGDQVAAGDLLASVAPVSLDPSTASAFRAELAAARARHAEALAAVREAEAANDQARREVDRRRPLRESGALTVETFERFEVAAAGSAAALERARESALAAAAAVEAAEARLLGAGGGTTEVLRIEAPSDGTILRVLEESERVVPAGSPLFHIGVTDGLEIVVDVLTEDAIRVSPGQFVHVSGWGGDFDLEGRVHRLEPAAFTRTSALGVDEQRVNVIVSLSNAPENLGAGYRVVADIVTELGTDLLSIPSSSVFQANGEWSVFVVEESRARLRRVALGIRGAERVEVVEGLAEGELVILYPSDQVEEGVRLTANILE